jgi:hypothetical protein
MLPAAHAARLPDETDRRVCGCIATARARKGASRASSCQPPATLLPQQRMSSLHPPFHPPPLRSPSVHPPHPHLGARAHRTGDLQRHRDVRRRIVSERRAAVAAHCSERRTAPCTQRLFPDQAAFSTTSGGKEAWVTLEIGALIRWPHTGDDAGCPAASILWRRVRAQGEQMPRRHQWSRPTDS